MLPAEEVEEELENNDDKLVNEDAANEDKVSVENEAKEILLFSSANFY